MSKKFIGPRQWIGGVLDKFGELEKFQPEPVKNAPEVPEWVSNIDFILAKVSHPGLNKYRKNWTAKDLGRFLGRHYAEGFMVAGQVPLSSQVINEGGRCVDGLVKILEKRPIVGLKKLQKAWEPEKQEWQPRLRMFMQETLNSACDRPYIETSAFFEGFGQRIIIKPDDLLTERTMGVGDKICWAMRVNWQDIDRLESVGQLHRLLEKALKPQGVIVKYKRVEKLCQRLKLKLKGPGRPPGSKNSDKL